jgi:cysteinyl-tRNA synthetase
MNEINVYNTLTAKKEPLVPREPGKIGMYCCGPTTYNFIHLGNARPLVVFDTIRRYLAYKGFDVTYIQNFTDVDDKIINRANEEGQAPQALANHYIEEYFKDADALGVRRATVHPTVSGHMKDIIDFVQALVDKGMAYEIDGDVYYSVSKFKDYGKLSKRNREDLLDGARVGVDERKKEAGDFALWKKAKPGEPFWESPWGLGRPGWHIECSAMSHKYLGESFDIHGGGFDLIFPHHENEIAQSEGRFGKPMAKYWMHNGFITVNQEKMSKSLGNFFMLRDILAKFPGPVVRFYLLSVHYRSPLDFDDQKLEIAAKGLDRLRTAARLSREVLDRQESQVGVLAQEQPGPAYAEELVKMRKQFEDAMDDDFNTALAIAVLFEMARLLNSWNASAEAPEIAAIAAGLSQLTELADVLGIDLAEDRGGDEEDAELNHALKALLKELGGAEAIGIEKQMAILLALRESARKAKDFAKSDRIRDGLKSLGILIEDTPQGPRWRRG